MMMSCSSLPGRIRCPWFPGIILNVHLFAHSAVSNFASVYYKWEKMTFVDLTGWSVFTDQQNQDHKHPVQTGAPAPLHFCFFMSLLLFFSPSQITNMLTINPVSCEIFLQVFLLCRFTNPANFKMMIQFSAWFACFQQFCAICQQLHICKLIRNCKSHSSSYQRWELSTYNICLLLYWTEQLYMLILRVFICMFWWY